MRAPRCLAFFIAAVSCSAQTPEPVAAEDIAGPGSSESIRYAEIQDKLAIALRSFRLLQDENDRLKAETRRVTAENALLSARLTDSDTQTHNLRDQLATAAATAAQLEILRHRLRQTQDQLEAVIAENTQLRTRLAITNAPPGSILGVPVRPDNLSGPAAQPPAASAVDLKVPEPRFHTVVEGDTLSKIARQYYGDGHRWPELLEANRNQLKDDRSLRFGVKLLIP